MKTKKLKKEDAEAIGARLCGRVRELRRNSGWTLERLSSACGVSRSMLSQIERNRANPTLGVAFRIAQAFGLSLNDLLDLPKAAPGIDVIRGEDRNFHFHVDADYRIRTLSPLNLEKDVEFYELILHPEKSLRSAAHYEGTREFLTVEQGEVRLIAGEERVELQRGDSAHYPADIPHAIENIGSGDAVIFLVDIYRKE